MSKSTTRLHNIRPGMEVYDADDNKIGTVKYVKPPEGDIIDADRLNEEALKTMVAMLNASAHIPAAVRARLRQDGFVRLNAGRLRTDRFVTVDQIEAVSDDRVHLNVTRDFLL
ncbi:MAG: DUF2171 domain-containing protein [Chloroflexi bacterium]|nr:DUF2171 domain-containing protein [Chloroflexota bacterium]